MLSFLALFSILLWPNNTRGLRTSPSIPNNYLVCQDDYPGLPDAHSHIWPVGYRPEHFESLTELCRGNPQTARRPGNVGCRCVTPDGAVFCDTRSITRRERRGTTALHRSPLRHYCRRYCSCPYISEYKADHHAADLDLLPASSSSTYESENPSSTCPIDCTKPNFDCGSTSRNCGCGVQEVKQRQWRLPRCIEISSWTGGKRDLGLAIACPCNTTYVSHGCCSSKNGLVWESPDKLLGTVVLGQDEV